MTTHTWADAFGVWHARVPRNAVAPLIAARRAIRDEILPRDANAAREVWMNPIRVPDLDDEQTIVYREGEPPVHMTTGAPVGVTLRADGSLDVTVYLGEIAQDDDADLSDEARAAIAAAGESGTVRVHFSRGA